jgi:hypothetical protein
LVSDSGFGEILLEDSSTEGRFEAIRSEKQQTRYVPLIAY